METNTDRLYSISQASQELGKSESTIKTYKSLVVEAFQRDTSLVTEPNGSLTEYGLEQLREAGRFIQKGDRLGYIKAVLQANPSLRPSSEESVPSSQPSAAGVEIYDGAPPAQMDLPSVPRSVDLARFRRTQRYGVVDLGAVQAAIGLTRQLGAAMDEDIDEQYRQLEATEQAAAELDSAIQDLDRQSLIYEIESRVVGRIHGTKTQQVQQRLGRLQALGKPTIAADGDTPT